MSDKEFREMLDNKQHITILGSGLVGCEFTNDLLNAGKEITMVSLATTPLDKLIPETAGKALEKAFTDNDVKIHWQTTIEKVETNQENNTTTVTLNNGTTFNTDLVISAVGLRPNTELAKQTNLEINHGIVVDQYLTTNNPNIFAIGDCAEVCGPHKQCVLCVLRGI